MRVGINCLSLNPSYVGGISSFTRGLLQGFASVADKHKFSLYATTRNQHLFEPFRNQPNFKLIVLEEWTRLLRGSLCRAALLSFNDKIYKTTNNFVFSGIRELIDKDADIVYTPSTVLQCFDSKHPTVLSMHDIQHVHYPEFFSWARRLSRRITYGLSAKYAHFFQASSEFIKEDLLRHFGCINDDQIAVIPEGVLIQEFSAEMKTTELCARYGIPDRFLLYPAQLWPHKNHLLLLQALKQIERSYGLQIPLVLTGGKFTAAPRVFGYMAEQSMNYISYLGRVPFQDLVALYKKAAFLVMPSLHESSSLPILEAAAAGTAIIASSIPPNEELNRVLRMNLFDPVDADELARLVYALWHDEATSSAQIAHNRRNIGVYSWENTARKFVRLFERIVCS